MGASNEEIARAAGLEWPVPTMIDHYGEQCVSYVDWPDDPGAVATYLLPVLEKREPDVVFDRDGENESGPWLCSIGRLDELIYSPTWHEAVIAAILATREDT